MDFETPQALLRRLKLGREEALQRMLTCLILRGPYPRWNNRSSLSAEGRAFLDGLRRLSFGDGMDEDGAIFVDELELAGRSDDERGGAPDWAVLLPDRLWIIELKTEAASHRRDQIPLYFDLGRHHFPGHTIDITYLTSSGTATHESPSAPDRFAHITWEDVRPLIASAWSDPRDPGEADLVAGVLRTIDEFHLPPSQWRAGLVGDEETIVVEVAPQPDVAPLPNSNVATADWLAAVTATAHDHHQRAIEAGASSLEELLELRHAINEHCRASSDASLHHVRPWMWRHQSGGASMTEGGRTSGYEVRVSRYASPSADAAAIGRPTRGPLESRYVQVHPGASTGIEACRWFEQHPNRWYTHAEIKHELGCSDRIIREHLPEALNEPGCIRIEIDTSEQAWRYRYRADSSTNSAVGVPAMRPARRTASKPSSVTRPLCTSCFIPVNPDGECDLCGRRVDVEL